MTETFAGSSFSRAKQTLTGLADDPDRLDRARRRFSASPPSFTSSKGPDSTLTNSPGAEVGPHVLRRTQKEILQQERELSRPRPQFFAQQYVEEARLIEHANRGVHLIPFKTSYHNHAYDVVKKRWKEQGIWSHEWESNDGSYRFGHKWMHEEPSPTDIDAKQKQTRNLFWVPPPPEQRKIEETPDQREAEREKPENSRPIHQFLWQIAHERDRISGEPTVGKVAASADLNINTKAYENVKEWWLACHIWDNKWGILPGMTWKHERPLEWPPKDDAEPASEAAYPNLVNGNNGGVTPHCQRLCPNLGWDTAFVTPADGIVIQNAWTVGLSAQLLAPMSSVKRDDGRRKLLPGLGRDSSSSWHQIRHPPETRCFHQDDQPRDVGMDDVIEDSQPHPPSQPIVDSSVERRPQKRPRGRPKKTRNGKVAKVQSGPSLGPVDAPSVSKPQRKSTRGRGRPKKNVQDHAAKEKATLSAAKQAATTAAPPRRSGRVR
ncbi:MAG: hypothetical protein LQ348_004451 [Seirophora lacunosa]|nr:MAG: hypothetical protein LQ348_004451 [Seirophora lacunosa]